MRDCGVLMSRVHSFHFTSSGHSDYRHETRELAGPSSVRWSHPLLPETTVSVFCSRKPSEQRLPLTQYLDVLPNSRTTRWRGGMSDSLKLQIRKQFSNSTVFKRSKETREKINLNEGTGRKTHLRASRMETRENVWKIDQWENPISPCSCQSGFYTEILLTHVFP